MSVHGFPLVVLVISTSLGRGGLIHLCPCFSSLKVPYPSLQVTGVCPQQGLRCS